MTHFQKYIDRLNSMDSTYICFIVLCFHPPLPPLSKHNSSTKAKSSTSQSSFCLVIIKKRTKKQSEHRKQHRKYATAALAGNNNNILQYRRESKIHKDQLEDWCMVSLSLSLSHFLCFSINMFGLVLRGTVGSFGVSFTQGICRSIFWQHKYICMYFQKMRSQ